jgi:probable DNA repair protein
VNQEIATELSNPIVGPKQASRIVLVPNREILQQFVAESLNRSPDSEVIVSPPIFTFSSWVESMAVQLRMLRCLEVPRTLDTWAVRFIWARAANRKLGQTGRASEWSVARQARSADQYLHQWMEKGSVPWLDESFNSMRWLVRKKLESAGAFSNEDWQEDLVNLLEPGADPAVKLPTEIRLRGFVEFTALEQKLLSALENHGVEVRPGDEQASQARPVVLEYQTPEEEWQAAATWAKSRLQSGADRLAIVINSKLTASGASSRRICQMLSATFHPQAAACLDVAAIQDFNIQSADFLIRKKTVMDALLLLRLSLAGLETELQFPWLSQWLLSPHWSGSDVERCTRARLELELREKGIHKVSLRKLCRIAREGGRESALEILIDKVEGMPASSQPSDAATWCHRILNHWGWPGPDGDEAMARVVAELGSLLERMSCIRFDSLQEAVDGLEVMCAETGLSAGGGVMSPVQVLTPEVAAAGKFDGVWVCHLDETNWPPPIAGNPYLPATALNTIPRLNPDGQLDYYRKLTEMLCFSAPEVCLSWSREGGEGPRSKSALISGFESREPGPVTPSGLAQQWVRDISDSGDENVLVAIDDPAGIGLPGGEAIELPGGSGFFRMQAACPLAGYLTYRLNARFPSAPTPLATPLFRGELLHQALRELYRTAAGMGARPDADEIPVAVDLALNKLHAREQLTRAGYLAEQRRLNIVLREWLRLDYSRTGFSVESLENAFQSGIGRARIKIRLDRLDRLADGSFFVIDYKSGGSSRSKALKWILPRIQEPQLPLYAVLLEEAAATGQAGGLAFAVVSPGKCGFDGICDDPEFEFKGIRPVGKGSLASWDWSSLMGHWRSQAEDMGEEILHGYADNRVFDPEIVRYSGLDLILRHDEGDDMTEKGT